MASHSHVLVYHGPLLIHLLGGVPSTFHADGIFVITGYIHLPIMYRTEHPPLFRFTSRKFPATHL